MKINVPHLELNPDMVTHSSTNQAGRRLTSLIETTALPLRQTTTLKVGYNNDLITSFYFKLHCVCVCVNFVSAALGTIYKCCDLFTYLIFKNLILLKVIALHSA